MWSVDFEYDGARIRSSAASQIQEEFSPHAFWLTQVHGNRVIAVDTLSSRELCSADGQFTTQSELSLGIKTADCMPVFLIAKGRAVAAIHAGWKGVLSKIVHEGFRLFKDHGIECCDVSMVIGPHIDAYSFDVQQDLLSLFGTRIDTGADILRKSNGCIALDLYGVLMRDLQEDGWCPKKVIRFGGDTFTNQQLCSYRRDNSEAGRIHSTVELL